MKRILILVLPLILMGCSTCCEDEEFTPYPNGKPPTDKQAH